MQNAKCRTQNVVFSGQFVIEFLKQGCDDLPVFFITAVRPVRAKRDGVLAQLGAASGPANGIGSKFLSGWTEL